MDEAEQFEKNYPMITSFVVQTDLGPRLVAARQGPNTLFFTIEGDWFLTEMTMKDEARLTIVGLVPIPGVPAE